MAKVVLAPAKLVVVRGLERGPAGATVCFKGGVLGHLPGSHRSFARWMDLLEDSLQRQRPFGVGLGQDGHIHDVRWADQDRVKWLGEGTEGPLPIIFWGHAGVYHLERDHPDFQRLYATVKRSAEHEEPIWFVYRSFPLTLLDVTPAPLAAAAPTETNGEPA
jgi:hypothetical protein